MEKFSYDDKLRIQMVWEQGLGVKAVISSYPDHKGWKLSFVKKVCSRVGSTAKSESLRDFYSKLITARMTLLSDVGPSWV